METRIGWDLTLAALLLAFALSMVVSWVYVATYIGLSYVRSFATTLGIGGVVSAIVMLSIGDDVARGIGLVGALTVIRFRTTLKDTRDLMFAFAVLSIGVACGVLAFTIAMLGTTVFCGAMAYLSFSEFGSRRLYNAVLRLQVPTGPEEQRAVNQVLAKYAPSFVLINMRDLGGGTQEHAYHLKIRDAAEKGQILKSVSAITGVSGATLLMQDTSIEP
jgi:hypothetical protein